MKENKTTGFKMSAGNMQPEFGMVDDVVRIFGIGRTKVFFYIKKGCFKTVLLNDDGNKKGKRLIQLQSVRDFLTSRFEK